MIKRTLGKYNDFTCIASECPKTCCSGWAVEIDDKTLDLYKSKNIDGVDYSENCFMQKDNGDCIYLNNRKLCDLYIKYGEGIFSKTCDMYPRHIEEFPNVREYSLSISCPVVAKDFLLDINNDVIAITKDSNDTTDDEEYDDFDDLLYEKLLELREVIFAIISEDNSSFDDKCRKILFVSRFVQDRIDEGFLDECLEDFIENGDIALDCINELFEESEYYNDVETDISYFSVDEIRDILGNLEPLDEDFIGNVLKMDDISDEDVIDYYEEHSNMESVLNKILFYFIYTYLCGASYDDYVYGMAAVAVYSALTIRYILINEDDSSIEKSAEVIYMYSRELEHSNENMILLEQILDEYKA